MKSGYPLVWLLSDDRPGNRNQSLALIEALGWGYEEKSLQFNSLADLPNILLGTSCRGVVLEKSSNLLAPWPDLVIAAGRRTAPVARWIKKRSHGRACLVQLGRKGGAVAEHFDLVVTLRHSNLMPHPQRLEILLPLTRVTSDRLDAARKQWPGLFAGQPEPHIVLVLGGETSRYCLDGRVAAEMGADVAALAKTHGGSVTVVTSRRTEEEVIRVLRAALKEDGRIHRWSPAGDNPYLACLAAADVLIVTGESESMLADAAATGKPFWIYSLPRKPGGLELQLGEWILRQARCNGDAGCGSMNLLQRLCRRAISSGFILPPRNMDEMYQYLIDMGIAQKFGQPLPASTSRFSESELVAQGVKDRFARSSE